LVFAITALAIITDYNVSVEVIGLAFIVEIAAKMDYVEKNNGKSVKKPESVDYKLFSID
jgi:predicted tellurium resistance membrane protein TerC